MYLISNQYDWYMFVRVLHSLDLLTDLCDSDERWSLEQRINEEEPLPVSHVTISDGTEDLLTGRVQNIQPNNLTIYLSVNAIGILCEREGGWWWGGGGGGVMGGGGEMRGGGIGEREEEGRERERKREREGGERERERDGQRGALHISKDALHTSCC